MSAFRVPFLDLKRVNARYQEAITKAIGDVVASGRYLFGPQVEAFEHEFAAYVGTRHCVGVANGLDALRLTLRAWVSLGRLAPGDEVIVPANTFIASALAVTDAGLSLRLADVDPETYNLSLETLEAALTPKTRVVMPVHLYGRLADMPRMAEYCRARSLLVLEDAAQAHGASSGGRQAGSFGDAGAFSFYPSKNLGALGDAGAVVTDDEDLALRVRALGNYGAAVRYRHEFLGVNSRMDEIQAAVLRVKLPSLDDDNRSRRAIAARYIANIAHASLAVPTAPEEPPNHVWHCFVIRTQFRSGLIQHLSQNMIEHAIHYPKSISHHRAFNDLLEHTNVNVADRLQNEVLSLPISPALDNESAADVTAVINEWRSQ